MIRVSAWSQLAPSVQAASSRATGTPSMKFFISHTAKGSWDVARKRDVPYIVSMRLICTKSPKTGTITAGRGRQVWRRLVSRYGRENRDRKGGSGWAGSAGKGV